MRPLVGLPGLHQRIRDRLPCRVVDPAGDSDRPGGALGHDERAVGPGQAEGEKRPDRLRRGDVRHHAPARGSKTVSSLPRSTMSHSKPSAQSGTVWSRLNLAIIRSRALGSGTELKIGSCAKSGSPGKYIWVTRRWVNARPNSEKWMCAGRQALGWFLHGYGPGLIVTNWYLPCESVTQRPPPSKLGSIGAGWPSTGWLYRPAAFACQISTSVPETGLPSESSTRPVRTIRSPIGSPA